MKMRYALIAGLVACVTQSFASISIRFDNTGLGQGIDYVYNGNGRSNFAGQLNFTNLTDSVAFTTFCVDLDHLIGGGQTYTVNLVPTIGDATFSQAGSVYANNYAAVATNDDATALQIAIWASRYGTDLATNSGGTFQLDSNWYANHGSIIAAAQNMVALGVNNPLDANRLVPDPEGSGQAQLSPVPEPASLLAVGAGLAALARRRRK